MPRMTTSHTHQTSFPRWFSRQSLSDGSMEAYRRGTVRNASHRTPDRPIFTTGRLSNTDKGGIPKMSSRTFRKRFGIRYSVFATSWWWSKRALKIGLGECDDSHSYGTHIRMSKPPSTLCAPPPYLGQNRLGFSPLGVGVSSSLSYGPPKSPLQAARYLGEKKFSSDPIPSHFLTLRGLSCTS